MIGRDLAWRDGVLAVLDFESTSAEPLDARPVQAAFVLATPRGYLNHGSYTRIINPDVEVPAEAAAIHGITTERCVADGVRAEAAIAQLIRSLTAIYFLDLPLLAYCGHYDWQLLHAEAQRHGMLDQVPPLNLIDPYVLDRGYDKFRKGPRKLVNLVEYYGVQLDPEGAHDARWDCVATAEVFRAQVRRYPQLQLLTPAELQPIQREMNAEWIASLSRFRVAKGEAPIQETPWPGWPPLQQKALAS